jgi:putative transposase
MNERRKKIRLGTENYRGRRTYFVTLCCAKRHPVFLDEGAAHQVLHELIASVARYDFLLHAYCLMPDHLHILVEGSNDGCDLMRFVIAFKRQTTLAHGEHTDSPLWQSRYYDHILRRTDATENVAWYIWSNPVRKGLCAAPQEYPFSGSFTIDWKSRGAPARLWSPLWRLAPP